MSKFAFLYRMPQSEAPSPREMEQRMERWMTWMKSLEEKGHLVSVGEPLTPEGAVVRKSSDSDGPYTEAKDIVMGFTLIEAADLAEARRLATGCPILAFGTGAVEVRPVRPRI